jgi:hypothetical protein
MRQLIAVLCSTLAFAALVKIASAIDDENDKSNWTDEQWQEYNEAAEKGDTEAGGATVIKSEAHKSHCKKGQYCPTIENGIIAGKKWCLKVGKTKCSVSHRNKTYKLYQEWGPWLDRYNGGRLALHMANTMRTESEGDPSSKTVSKIREVGLMSIKAQTAKRLDIDACHPEANIWAAGYVANEQRLKFAKKYPQIKKAPRLDWEKLAGACGSVGSNRVYQIINSSGALREKDDGTLFYSSPYDRVLKWMHWKAKKEGAAIYSFEFAHIFGPIPGLTAFRISRSDAGYKILSEFYPDGFPWETHELIERPSHFPTYPGDKLHGRCEKHPEWRDLRPSAAEFEAWNADTSIVKPIKPSTWKDS